MVGVHAQGVCGEALRVFIGCLFITFVCWIVCLVYERLLGNGDEDRGCVHAQSARGGALRVFSAFG